MVNANYPNFSSPPLHEREIRWHLYKAPNRCPIIQPLYPKQRLSLMLYWKAFFIFYALYSLWYVQSVVTGKPVDYVTIANITAVLFSIVSFYGYSFQKPFGKQILWKVFAVAWLAYNGYVAWYLVHYYGALLHLVPIHYKLLGAAVALITVASISATFGYAFKSRQWSKGT